MEAQPGDQRPPEPLLDLKATVSRYLDTVASIILILDVNGRILYLNAAAERLIGFTLSELAGKDWVNEFVPRMDAESTRSILFRMRDGETPTRNTNAVKTRGGGLRTLSWNNTLVRNDAGLISAIVCTGEDITETIALQDELERTREKMESALESGTILLITVDSLWRIDFVNRRTEVVTGYSREALVGQDISTLLPRLAGSDVEDLRHTVLGGGTYGPVDVSLRTKPGVFLEYEVTVDPIYIHGSVVGAVVTARDLIKRRESESRIRLQAAILDQVDNAVVASDMRGGVVYWNKEAEKLFEKKRSEAMGIPISDIWGDRVSSKGMGEIMAAVYEKGSWEGTLGVKKETGEERMTVLTISLVEDVHGAPVAMVGVTTDITERLKMEQALKESEERFRRLAENAVDVVFRISPDKGVEYVNKSVEKVLGYTIDEMYGNRELGLQLISPGDVYMQKEMLDELRAGVDFAGGIRSRWTSKDGRIVHLDVSVVPVVDALGKLAAVEGIARDVTKTVELEEELKKYSQELERLVEKRTEQLKESQARLVKVERMAAIGELAAQVAHDLRNPLTSINTSVFFLRDAMVQGDKPEVVKTMTLIEKSVKHANAIVSDLLEYSRTEVGERKEVTLLSMVRSALERSPVGPYIKVELNVKPSLTVYADEQKMFRVFSNLFRNAADAMPGGGTLTVNAVLVEDTATIEVKDTGVGIKKEHLEKLFTPFFTTKSQGMGLGLPICKRIVEGHGGTISINSVPKKGTTVTLTLPTKVSAARGPELGDLSGGERHPPYLPRKWTGPSVGS
jgi:PAS domain S-box-containing protein